MREEEVCLVVPSNRQPSTTGKCRKPNLSSQSGWTDGKGLASVQLLLVLLLLHKRSCSFQAPLLASSQVHTSSPFTPHRRSCPVPQSQSSVAPLSNPSHHPLLHLGPTHSQNSLAPKIVLLPNVSPRLEVNATSPRRWSPIVPMEVFPPMTSTKPRRQDKSTDHGRRLDDAKQPSIKP